MNQYNALEDNDFPSHPLFIFFRSGRQLWWRSRSVSSQNVAASGINSTCQVLIQLIAPNGRLQGACLQKYFLAQAAKQILLGQLPDSFLLQKIFASSTKTCILISLSPSVKFAAHLEVKIRSFILSAVLDTKSSSLAFLPFACRFKASFPRFFFISTRLNLVLLSQPSSAFAIFGTLSRNNSFRVSNISDTVSILAST